VRRLIPLLASVFIAASPAHAEWWEAKTEHFVIYAQDGERSTREFATKLESFDHALRSLQATKFEPVTADWQRVTIYRSGDLDYMQRLAHFPAGGFYLPQMNPVEFTPVHGGKSKTDSIIKRDSRTDLDPQSVLFHEYAHHFMFQYFPAAYPSWYIEAFAETVATLDLHPDGSFHVGNPPQYRSDALFNQMITVTPQSLLASTAKPDGEDQFGWYTVGWLVNHYLTFGPSRKGQLQTYLRLVNGGMNSAPAARQAFGDLDKLASEVQKYKHSGKLGGADVVPATKANPQVTMRRLGPDEEAVMKAVIRTKSNPTKTEKRGVAGEVRDLARQYPNSLPIQLELAKAELDLENYDAASAAADRAIQINPDSVEALVDKARIFLERGKTDKKYLPESRVWAAKAHDVDPQNPEPLYVNYLAYFYEGGAIPESALIGLEQAFVRARQDYDVRQVLGRQLLAEKKGPLARDILISMALDPHQSKFQKEMREVIDLIDANKVDEAHTKLAALMKKAEDDAKNGGD
jgi:tetratricopeptide (TPR) repeat protein